MDILVRAVKALRALTPEDRKRALVLAADDREKQAQPVKAKRTRRRKALGPGVSDSETLA